MNIASFYRKVGFWIITNFMVHCVSHYTSKMIYHRGAEPERACIADSMFCHAHKPWITAGFVTVCCSMSMVSKTLYSHFSSQGSYYTSYSHSWTKLHNLLSWAESWHLYHYLWSLPEVNSTIVHDLTVPSVSSLPWSTVDFSTSMGVEFVTECFSTCANLS